MFIYAPHRIDRPFMIACVGLAIVSFVSVLRSGDSEYHKLNKVFFRHSVIFLIALFVVSFQRDIDFLLGYIDIYTRSIYNYRIVAKGMALSVMALSSFAIGYGIMHKWDGLIKGKNWILTYPQGYNKLLICATLFLAIYIVITPFGSADNYSDILTSGSGKQMTIITLLVAAIMALCVIRIYTYIDTDKQWFSYFKYLLYFIMIYVVGVCLTGRRTEAVRVAFMLFASYIFCKWSTLKNWKLMVVGLSVAVYFTLVGLTRTDTNATLIDGYGEMVEMKSFFPPTSELAGSVLPFHVALSYYPEKIPYVGPVHFFLNLNLIPQMKSIFEVLIPDLEVENAGLHIGRLFWAGKTGAGTYGIGNQCVADLYVYGGPLFIIFVMCLLGCFMRYLEVGTFGVRKSPYFVVLSICVYSQILFASRGSYSTLFLCFTHACILLYLFNRPKKIS
jgi:oligosaccharide repeat unit polymerase